MFFVYKITNMQNNKIYIGQTNNLKQRWAQYKSSVKRKVGDLLVIKSMIKRGVINFLYECIATCKNQDDCNLCEIECIKQYDAQNMEKGYNIDPGGKNNPRSPQTIAKITASRAKYFETHDGWNKGGTLTEEHKQNISKSSMGKPGTNTGKTFNNEWRMNLSKANAGNPVISRRKFSDVVEREICRQYVEEEKSTYQLAKDYDIYRSLIISILDRNNI